MLPSVEWQRIICDRSEVVKISLISLGLWVKKFPAENLLITYVNQLFPSPALQSNAVK